MELLKEYFDKIRKKPSIDWHPVTVPDQMPRRNSRFFQVFAATARYTHEGYEITDEQRSAIIKVAMYFAGCENSPLDLRKGLFLWGKAGCGKTLLMRVMHHYSAVYNRGNNFKSASTLAVTADYDSEGSAALSKYYNGSIVFDDLGNEPTLSNYYGSELPVMPTIIHRRYELFTATGWRTHFTSNFDLEFLETHYGKREVSRLREMCNVVRLPGADKRK